MTMLNARIGDHNGRPVLFINNVPTTEFWCYGDPNAIQDFQACGMRICQFHVPFPSWWTGPDGYDFEPTARTIREFLELVPGVLLMPRVNFGYVGEEWWAKLHPEELAVGLNLEGQPVDYAAIRARPVDCWFSSASRAWTDDASRAMRAFVSFCEERFGEHVLGYQIGGGISAEWFRWWNFVEGVYEDYSAVALHAFRQHLKDKYASDEQLRSAWGRTDVSLTSAELPAPRRQHETALGYLRDPRTERDVVDWLECLSANHVSQILSLADAAKDACAHRKLVGTFFGYLWPHWNTQCPARAGHVGLDRLLASPSVDFISSPYHYDHRHVGGFHHSQTSPETIERGGKLHLDEIDTFTHLVDPEKTRYVPFGRPTDARESCQLLRRDAASVLGTAGTGWWMDLHSDRWFADGDIQAELRRLQRLACQSLEWDARTQAEVALVVDDRSYAWASPWSGLNQCFTSMPRQLEWSDLGFPIDTLMLRELPQARPYRMYVFLNCWYMESALRRQVARLVRSPGTTSVWFHACGCIDENACSPANAAELVGMQLEWIHEPTVPQIEFIASRDTGVDPLVADLPPHVHRTFGARLRPDQTERLIAEAHHDWSNVRTPTLAVSDPKATALGRYTDGGQTGLAIIEQDGRRSVFCGAPLLPGWLLARIAVRAGIHAHASSGTQILHRGPLLAAYRPQGGVVDVVAPAPLRLRPLVYVETADAWRPQGEPRATFSSEFESGETKFFWME